MNDFPPPGAYCIDDPREPWRLSYWTVSDTHELKAWPSGAGSTYGPPRPAKPVPGASVEVSRDEMKFWRARVADYRDQVLTAISRDPIAAATRFTAETDRCHRCRSFHRAEELSGSAAGGHTPVDKEPLPAEQRRTMIADLRRAGHSEKAIAQALQISPKTVNREARRAGVGAPLKPRTRSTEPAGQSVAVTTHRDNLSRDNTGELVVAGPTPVATNRGNPDQGNSGDLEVRGSMSREQAETVVRDALLSAVALTVRDVNQVDVDVATLLEGSDHEATMLLLARMLGAVLGVVLPDNGRRLLAQVAANAIQGDQE